MTTTARNSATVWHKTCILCFCRELEKAELDNATIWRWRLGSPQARTGARAVWCWWSLTLYCCCCCCCRQCCCCCRQFCCCWSCPAPRLSPPSCPGSNSHEAAGCGDSEARDLGGYLNWISCPHFNICSICDTSNVDIYYYVSYVTQ